MLDRLRLIDGVANVTLQTSSKSASSGGGTGGAGGCPTGQPAYSAQIAFDPLPTPSATAVVSNAAAHSAATSRGGAR
jgi:hypothetical protein